MHNTTKSTFSSKMPYAECSAAMVKGGRVQRGEGNGIYGSFERKLLSEFVAAPSNVFMRITLSMQNGVSVSVP